MAIRITKIILVLFVGLQGWLYVAGNLANWDAGLSAIAYVLGMQEHTYYANHLLPPITSPALVTAAFVIIVFGEFLVGALSFKGVWDLWKARKSSAETFNASKTCAILGPATAMVVWFGGFIVLGGGLFQMWQTQIGDGSFTGSFVYAATSGLVLLFVQADDR